MQTDNEKRMELKDFLMKFGSRLSEKTTNHLSVVYDPLSAGSTAMAEEYGGRIKGLLRRPMK